MITQGQFFQGLYGDSSYLMTTFHHCFPTTRSTCLLSHCSSLSSYSLHSQAEVDSIALGFCRDNSTRDGNKAPCA